MSGFSKARELNTTSHQLGHAKGLLQSLIIASEMPADIREDCMLAIARQADGALRKELAA